MDVQHLVSFNQHLVYEMNFILNKLLYMIKGNWFLHTTNYIQCKRMPDLEERELTHIYETPDDSTRRMAFSENVDHMSVWQIV